MERPTTPVLLLLVGIGCSGTDDPDTTDTTDTATGTLPECSFQDAGFAACLAGGPAGKTTQTPYAKYVYGSRAGEAEVVAVGDPLASDCAEAWGVGGPAVALVSDPDVVWLQLEHDDGSLVTLGMKAEGFDGSRLTVGTSLTYDFASAEFAWSPSVGHLEVRDASGALVLWMAEGGRLEDVQPPAELSIARGAATCWTADECVGGWQQSGLMVEVGADAVEVLPHDSADLGGVHVVHGGFDEQTGMTTCPDAYVADLKVAAWPL